MANLKAILSSDRAELVTRLGNQRITSSIDTYDTFATIEQNGKGGGWFQLKRGREVFKLEWNDEGDNTDIQELDIQVQLTAKGIEIVDKIKLRLKK